MSEPVGHVEIRAETVMQAARTMAGAAMTAPKSGGMLFLKGSPVFLETVIVDDSQTRKRLADWMRARGERAAGDNVVSRRPGGRSGGCGSLRGPRRPVSAQIPLWPLALRHC